MRNPNADENDLQMSDFWCDYCRRPWTEDLPIVEGHQGSLVCGKCLTLAYRDVVLDELPTPAYEGPDPHGPKCTMCLEHREDLMWRSPAYDDAWICKRCIRQASTALAKDKDIAWEKPV
ncbi:MAG: hypothetical protein EA379_03000 [Phycisphaerales bacterium]|nr:MAG: hypothetical protein EA379_03000 [Phycisphaerales bacterium]